MTDGWIYVWIGLMVGAILGYGYLEHKSKEDD